LKYTNTDFNNKTILITGGAGFIGSNLAFYFQNNYPDSNIIILDSFRSGETLSNGNLKSFGHFKNIIGFNGKVISGDINDDKILSSLEDDYDFDYIYHQAAISDTTALEQDLMIKTNVNAYENILKIAIKHNANMVYASSAATYGSAKAPQKVGEENPGNVYGFSKLMMDNISKKYIDDGAKISIVGLRYFNVYGSNEYYKNTTASMVLQLGLQILSGKKPKLFYGSDEIKRDFIFIEDIVQANIKASDTKYSGIYNVGTGLARSFEDIAKILLKELKSNLEIEYFDNPYDKSSYQFLTQADIEDTISKLDYKPNYSLEDGIKGYINYIKEIANQIK
jgi:ADP-L-glycero-D-manno-heptose 6-epimerase